MSAKKILLVVFGLITGSLVGLGLLAVLVLPRLVEERILAEARARGVDLSPGKVSFGIGWLQIKDARLSLIGVPGLSIRVGVIDCEIDRLSPVRFTLANVQTESIGELLTLVRALDSWARAHPPKREEPLFVKPMGFKLRSAPKATPGVELDGAELRVEGDRAELIAKRSNAFGRDLGELRLVLGDKAMRADLTFGQSPLHNPLMTLAISEKEAGARTIQATLAPVLLGRLGEILGVRLPKPNATLSGTLDARVPQGWMVGARISGRLDGVLKGYVPPHPAELDGFVFGDTTSFGTGFLVEPEQLRIVLESTSLRAGRFELSGGGELRAEGLDARLKMLLSGTLPCNALAGAAAETRLGRSLGQVTGKAARQVVSGNVGVRVSVEAWASALERAQILKTITPGCGLKALTLKELVQLGELVPEALRPEVAQDFEKLLEKGLPQLDLPGGGISLQIPGFGALPSPVRPEAPRPANSNR